MEKYQPTRFFFLTWPVITYILDPLSAILTSERYVNSMTGTILIISVLLSVILVVVIITTLEREG